LRRLGLSFVTEKPWKCYNIQVLEKLQKKGESAGWRNGLKVVDFWATGGGEEVWVSEMIMIVFQWYAWSISRKKRIGKDV